VAHHLLAGGDGPAAVPYLLSAGRDAKRVFANEEARAFLQKALSILDSPRGGSVPGDPAEIRFETLGLLGDLGLLTSRHEEALASFERMRDLARAAVRPGIEGAAEVGIGLSHYNRAQFARALESFRAAADRFRAAGDPPGIARALDKIGNVHTKQGRYDEALQLFGEGLVIRREIGDRLGEAESLNNLGIVYRNLGRLEEALEAQERAVALKRESGERRGTATSLINLGNVLLLLQRRAEALVRYEEALQYCREIGDRRLMAYPLSSMGNTFFQEDNYDAALEHYGRALAIYDEIDDRWGSGRALNNCGVIELRRAEYGAAREHLLRSAALKRDVDDARSLADTLINLGEVHRRLGSLDEAWSAHEEASRITAETGDKRLLARVRLGLGCVAADRDERGPAADLLREARRAAGEIDSIETEVAACALLARVLEADDQSEARACAERALERARDAGDTHDRALGGLCLARMRLASGETEVARSVLEQAAAAAASHGFREILCGCFHLQTSIHLSEGRIGEAAEAASSTVQWLQEILNLVPRDRRVSFISRPEIRPIVETAIRAHRESGLVGEAERILAWFSKATATDS
jgi:tetratricopeptide (TPR) repeat protein